jgi:hypothetical protein
VQDAGVVASTSGATVDIDSGDGLVAVIDNGTSTSSISFTVDEDGNLSLRLASSINSLVNGVAVVRDDDDAHHFNW